jgi:hypothetical protein
VRLLKILLTALFATIAVIAGLVTAAVVAVAGVLIYFMQRLIRPKRVLRRSYQRRDRMSDAKSDDVIEVTATEVSPDHSSR